MKGALVCTGQPSPCLFRAVGFCRLKRRDLMLPTAKTTTLCPCTLWDGHSSANASPSDPSSRLQRRERSSLAWGWECLGRCMPGARPSAHLSKMAPTPALCALFRCTCSPVASRIPSFTAMERWEKEAMRSSFHPGRRKQPRPRVRAMGCSVGSGTSNVTSLALEGNCSRPACLCWMVMGREWEPPLSWMSGKEKNIKAQMH